MLMLLSLSALLKNKKRRENAIIQRNQVDNAVTSYQSQPPVYFYLPLSDTEFFRILCELSVSFSEIAWSSIKIFFLFSQKKFFSIKTRVGIFLRSSHGISYQVFPRMCEILKIYFGPMTSLSILRHPKIVRPSIFYTVYLRKELFNFDETVTKYLLNTLKRSRMKRN